MNYLYCWTCGVKPCPEKDKQQVIVSGVILDYISEDTDFFH